MPCQRLDIETDEDFLFRGMDTNVYGVTYSLDVLTSLNWVNSVYFLTIDLNSEDYGPVYSEIGVLSALHL